jgi:hypothetical protein
MEAMKYLLSIGMLSVWTIDFVVPLAQGFVSFCFLVCENIHIANSIFDTWCLNISMDRT